MLDGLPDMTDSNVDGITLIELQHLEAVIEALLAAFDLANKLVFPSNVEAEVVDFALAQHREGVPPPALAVSREVAVSAIPLQGFLSLHSRHGSVITTVLADAV